MAVVVVVAMAAVAGVVVAGSRAAAGDVGHSVAAVVVATLPRDGADLLESLKSTLSMTVLVAVVGVVPWCSVGGAA